MIIKRKLEIKCSLFDITVFLAFGFAETSTTILVDFFGFMSASDTNTNFITLFDIPALLYKPECSSANFDFVTSTSFIYTFCIENKKSKDLFITSLRHILLLTLYEVIGLCPCLAQIINVNKRFTVYIWSMNFNLFLTYKTIPP